MQDTVSELKITSKTGRKNKRKNKIMIIAQWDSFPPCYRPASGSDYLNVSSSSTCRAAQRLELQGVQAYSNTEGLQGLHTLPTAIVDYRGVRLSAQGLAPGLESSDQEQGASPASR